MTSYTHTISSGLKGRKAQERHMAPTRREIWIGALALGLAGVGLASPARAETALGEQVEGDPAAPIEIIEYASLTCPHCAAFHSQTLPQVDKEWIATGKARLVYRDFPLDELALRAAMLAHCAGPKRYFAFIGVLFKQQQVWARSADPLKELAKIGRLGGISQQAFDACMADQSLLDAILKVRLDGAKNHDVSATPTLIINGEKHAGALSYDEINRVLTKHLP